MKVYSVKVKSTTPLLINVRKREVELEMKKLKKSELEEWEDKNWHRKAEVDANGKVIIPPRWFRSSFIQACKSLRIVPHYATRKSETYTKYAEGMFFDNTTFTLEVKKLKAYGAYVGAQGKNSSTKVWRIRPTVEKWECEFEITDPFGRMNQDELKEILEYSGMMVGVGDGRNLNFGRFELIEVKCKKDK